MKKLSEDHKEIESGKIKDDEGYMAKVEMQKIMQSLQKLKKVIKTSDQQLPAWVQSKISKASDYLDIAADYLSSDVEMDEDFIVKKRIGVLNPKETQLKHSYGAGALSPEAAQEVGDKAVELRKKKLSKVELPKFNEELSLVDKILTEMMGDKPGCGTKKPKKLNAIAKKHKVSIESLEKQLQKGIKVEMEHTKNKNLAEIIAFHHLDEIPDYYTRLLKMEKEAEMNEAKKYMDKDEDPCWKGYEMVGFKKKRGKKVPNCVPVKEEMTRLPMKTGNMMRVLISWRNRHISCQMFFPQIRTPNKVDITYEVNKVYPGAKVISFVPCEVDASLPIIQIQNGSKNYLINNQTIGEEKENKPLNKPMRTPGEAKKFKVYVKDPKTGNIVTVRFGDPNMDIKRDDPERRKNFRARHNCDDATDKTTPKYWSCYQWRAGKKVED